MHLNTPAYPMWTLKNPVLIILKLWNFVCCLKYFHDKTTTNYHRLGLRGCFDGLSWHECLRRGMFQTCMFFVCLHDMSLSCVFLDPAIIVLEMTCACGTPWTFLLTFFNKWCKMEDGNVAISLCLIIMLVVQHWEFDVTGGGRGDGCVRLSFPLIIGRLILLVLLICELMFHRLSSW